MLNVAIDKKPLTSGHAIRGIGVHTNQLIGQINKTKDSNIKLSVVDFEKTDLARYDLVHYPYFHPFFLTLPSSFPTKVVVTVHDLIQLVYPKQYSPGLRGRLRFIQQKQLVKKVDGIITISEASKKDIVRFLGVEAKKIKVIYLAPKKIFKKYSKNSTKLENVRKKYNLPKRFVLYVGDVNYNKNIPSLISACKTVKMPLVIVGKQARGIETKGLDISTLRGPQDWIRFLLGIPHPELVHYSRLLSEFNTNPEIFRLGFVSDEDLTMVYNLATVYCQPSFYEGFGLPVMEAMACGTPVVIARNNALVEIAEGAALVADPKNPRDFAGKISQILKKQSLKKELIKKGSERVRTFSWKKTAEETLEYYKKVVEG